MHVSKTKQTKKTPIKPNLQPLRQAYAAEPPPPLLAPQPAGAILDFTTDPATCGALSPPGEGALQPAAAEEMEAGGAPAGLR